MRPLKFNKFERVAGLFVLFAIGGVLVTALSVAIKQGWFESKIFYSTIFENADGIHQGTLVQMAGLKAGAVDAVELQTDNKIRVHFYLLGRFKERVHEDSVTQLIRPFVIGERVLDVGVGSEKSPLMAANSAIPSVGTVDFISLLNGKTWNNYLGRVGELLDNMKFLINSFADKGRIEGLVKTIDRVDPLIKNMNTMSVEVIKLSKQASSNNGVEKLVSNLAITTAEINKILPELNRQNPALAKDMAFMIKNVAVMMNAMGPALKSIEPELPGASLRLIEALNETVVVLKAMQKSYFMKGSVREVHEEEALRRAPASQRK
jgi:phospholipid/cholesterol/gamma-HCH transport system substrate-binding protein